MERQNLLTGKEVKVGDIILGLASNGLHSNGFSLVRKVTEIAGFGLHDPAPFNCDITLGEALLEPTRIYVQPCLSAIESGGVHAIAHITGGGLPDNLPRILPKGTLAHIDAGQWSAPPVFKWLKRVGNVSITEMYHTFNCGIGMALVTAHEKVDTLSSILTGLGETVHIIGEIKTLGDDNQAINIVNREVPLADER